MQSLGRPNPDPNIRRRAAASGLVVAIGVSLGGMSAMLPGTAVADECTFDQAGVASELHRIASRRPGAVPLPHRSAVEWRETSGETVRLSFGGCVDLGVQIELRSPPGTAAPPSLDALLAAVERYWSPATARVVRTDLDNGTAVPRLEGDATVTEIGSNEEFPFGATLRIDATGASISWTAG